MDSTGSADSAMITDVFFYGLYGDRDMINKTRAMIIDDFYGFYRARAMINSYLTHDQM